MSAQAGHEHYMRMALELARKGAGRVSPNPMVGAVVVRGRRVAGAGFHRAFGTAHAEVHALRRAGRAAQGADLYVTLEPCSHYGKTPPCVDAVIASGIKRVFIGQIDPNPVVRGRGIRRLRAAGIEVTAGILKAECAALNAAFSKHITTGLPLVTLKAAMTLDGRIATRTGDSKWISCARSRALVHRMRAEVDAVMVGIGTVIADNPRLNVRLGRARPRDPVRIVVDTRLRIDPGCNLLQPALACGTLIVTGHRAARSRKADLLRSLGAEVLGCALRGRRVDLAAAMSALGKRGIGHIMLEGGAALIGEALRCRIVDRVMLFYAPKLLGASDGVPMAAGRGPALMNDSAALVGMSVRTVGSDCLVEGRLDYGSRIR
jgi:diaminohydroxyphosphoribosylaminopyrimidine deaminase/5-amino-6-(5-phosphoribosylamino)uracil reductase